METGVLVPKTGPGGSQSGMFSSDITTNTSVLDGGTVPTTNLTHD